MGAPSKWNYFDKFQFTPGNNALVTAVCSPFAGMASDLPTFSVSPMVANSWRSSATNHATARSVPAMVPSSRRRLFFDGEVLRKCEEKWS